MQNYYNLDAQIPNNTSLDHVNSCDTRYYIWVVH